MVVLTFPKQPVEREVPFDGGVTLTMRRANGIELAAARQESFDWQQRILGGQDAWAQIGMAVPDNSAAMAKMLAGLVLLYQAKFLFPVIVTNWNYVDAQGEPQPITNMDAVQDWLLLGSNDSPAQLEPFLAMASRLSVAEASEGNVLRPLPNGSGAMASTTASSADPQTPPAPEGSAG